MRVAVSAAGADLEAQTSPVFGRCPFFIFVDTDTMEFEAVPNEAAGAAGGAGVQAAQMVGNAGADAVITGNAGPNAFSVLQAAGIPIYVSQGGTVRQTVEAFKAGQLAQVGGATVPPHSGMGGGRGGGRGGRGRSM